MIEAGILGAIGIAERIAGFELATLTSGNVRFDANIDTTLISVRIRRQSLTYSAWQFARSTLCWMLTRKRGGRLGWSLILARLQDASREQLDSSHTAE
jgi:hypothetical protein